ncbi:MAG: tetratricopeptide repeat protein, partial [Fimbriimonadaceae bacterium]
MRTRPDPRRADELHRAALTAYGLGSLAEAVRMLQKSVELAPANGEAWGNLGVLLRQAGRAEEAERALRRSCELAPRRAAGWNALGAVLLDRGDPVGAESAL